MRSRRRWPIGCRPARCSATDLFEGTFARAGLASDIEVIEEFPARYDVAAARNHRWVRGDWQLLPWLFGRPDASRRGTGTLPLLGQWKMLDNLRRSLSAPTALLALLTGWLLPLHAALIWTAFVLTAIALPALLPALAAIVPRRGVIARSHLTAWSSGRGARLHADRIAHRISPASGMAHGRCHLPHAVPAGHQPTQPARVGHSGPIAARLATGPGWVSTGA